LYCFPREYTDDSGNLFWSSPKRPPYVIEFDVEDEMHFMFVRSVVTILADVFKLTVAETDDQIREFARSAAFTVA